MMAATPPRRSSRIPYIHTPKLSDRKKGLFQPGCEPTMESLTNHRRLPVLDSESDSEGCDLGIISALDFSSGEENTSKTPEKTHCHETRSQTRRLLKEHQDLKHFMRSPFTLTKYQTRNCQDMKCTGSLSTPATPHLRHHPGTPSSTHSCASAHTSTSSSSKARKSLAGLIADTESCSSSLKDLNFDTDSGTDSKENTPTKSIRRSSRRKTINSFKGVLVEQKKNMSPLQGISPMKTAVVCLTKMDMSSFISPTQILRTPHTAEAIDSPPKLSHRRSVVEIAESPESTCDSDKSYKRLRNESMTEHAPNSKYPRLENAPKARLSLFNSDRLKEILSAKSFYGKSNPELNKSITAKISNAIEVSTVQRKRYPHSDRRKRKPGQINSGVKHRIRKPKHYKNKIVKYNTKSAINTSLLNSSTISNVTASDTTMISQNSSQDLTVDKTDPFDKEKQTIEALLSQWEEDEVPESELSYIKSKELPCFNSTVIEETNQIFQPITAVPVKVVNMPIDDEAVIIELGNKAQNTTNMSVTALVANSSNETRSPCVTNSETNLPRIETNSPRNETNSLRNETNSLRNETNSLHNETNTSRNETNSPHNETFSSNETDVVMADTRHVDRHGQLPKTGEFLPVEGGYILVGENGMPEQEVLPDLDEIERELKMLDEQILKMAESNNINATAVLASTENIMPLNDVNENSSSPVQEHSDTNTKPKLFPIFSNPNPGVTPQTKAEKSGKKSVLKSASDQYIIDAGQKKFGATQCTECGAIYQIGDPQDEHDHLVHHNASDVLKFNPLKEECVIERTDTWRVIRIRATDSAWRRVSTLLTRVVHPQLGYSGPVTAADWHSLTAYLYIEKKQIVGCVVAETKSKAYKMIPGEPDCCSIEHYPVKMGISRLWTHLNHRRRGVAKTLVDCARVSFLYGQALRTEEVAFSAPTSAGKAFAAKYCGTDNFYVYLE